MFKPIIHNLKPGDKGYSECQLYNNLIASKPTNGNSLASKIAMQSAWKRLCEHALEKAKSVLVIETV